jgi:hypothetical protein
VITDPKFNEFMCKVLLPVPMQEPVSANIADSMLSVARLVLDLQKELKQPVPVAVKKNEFQDFADWLREKGNKGQAA